MRDTATARRPRRRSLAIVLVLVAALTALSGRSSANADSDPSPFGSLDAVALGPGFASIQGWAADPETAAPIEVDALVDGALAGYQTADRYRSDVGAALPAFGPRHGFALNAALGAGQHELCVYAINVGSGVNRLLGCQTVVVPASPLGQLDALVVSNGKVWAQGWALDQQTAAPIEIDILVDGALTGWGTADRYRPDVGGIFPLFGSWHGYEAVASMPAGQHTVCVYGINVGVGINSLLGCKSLTLSPSTSTTATAPALPTTAPPTTAPPTAAPTTTAPAPTTTTTAPAATTSYPTSWTGFPSSGTFREYTSGLHPTVANQLLSWVSIIDFSGYPSVMPDQNGYNGYTLDTFRMQTREGPRAAGAPITLRNGYIEVHAESGDHSDGVQFYGGGGALIQNTKILAGGDGATGIFAADSSHGTITLDGDYFGWLSGYSRPGFLVRINADGADQVRVRNTVFECGAAAIADISITAPIVEWTNNHCTDGRLIPKP